MPSFLQSTSAVLAACFALASAGYFPPPSNSDDGKTLTFQVESDGLRWPITSSWDAGIALLHGQHCLKLILAKTALNASDFLPDEVHHLRHCALLASRMADYLDTAEKLPEEFCQDLRTLENGPQPLGSAGRFKRSARARLSALSDHAFDYPESRMMMRKKREVGSADSGHNEIFGILLHANGAAGQQELFDRIRGANVGSVFEKRERGLGLSAGEAAFLRDWERPEVLRLSAHGAYCRLLGSGEEAVAAIRRIGAKAEDFLTLVPQL